jgi:hypothetical protein
VTCDYQLGAGVQHVVAKIIMSSGRLTRDVQDVILVLGGDHGVGAFWVTFCTIIVFRDTAVEKDI